MNNNYYEEDRIVGMYSSYNFLLKPEEAIITKMGKELSGMTFLDIGVGGGRTTTFFSPLVKEYVGVDQSRKMIEACRRKYPVESEILRFLECDARDMKCFPENRFDFIMFSYNGVDCMEHDERMSVFQEVVRVGKDRGLFFFSTHNMNSLGRALYAHHLKRPRGIPWRLYFYRFLKKHNDLACGMAKEHAFFREETNNLDVGHYYIWPKAQLAQLANLGFYDVEVYSCNTGKRVPIEDLEGVTEDWLYFLCRIKK